MKTSGYVPFSGVVPRRFVRNKCFGWRLVLGLVGSLFLAACGGDKSSDPQLELSTEAIQTTYVLGSAPVGTEIALRNIGDELLTFSLTGPAFWVAAASATSGEIVPGGEATIQFTLECSVPGDVAGTITISGNFGSDASLSASLRCQAPPITVALSEPVPDSAGHPRLNAQSEMQWSIASTWSGQPAVNYDITIVSSNDHVVTVDPASGSVELDSTVVINLDAACPAPRDQDVELRITAGDGLLDAVWSLDCQGGSGAVRRVELYQGPMAMREVYEADDSEEEGTFTTRTFTNLVPGRDGVGTVRVEHGTDYMGEPVFSIVDGSSTAHPVELEILSASDPDESASGNYETEFMFPMPGPLFAPGNTFRADIDVDGSDDGPAREHVLAMSDLSFFDTPLMRIRLFRLENNKGIPNIDTQALNLYMHSIMNFMPVSNVEMTVEGVINHDSGTAWNAFNALSSLQDHWMENAEADEYYHGVFIYRRGDPAGIAYLSGKVGMSLDLFQNSSPLQEDANTFAHEMGHNYSLQHSPCGGPGRVDPNYPYKNARLGPRRVWSSFQDRFIGPKETFYDLQSYCRPRFTSDYSFKKAGRYLGQLASLAAQQPPKVLASNTSDYAHLTRTGKRAQGLALTGHVDDQGQWSFRRAVYSDQNPLPIDSLAVHSHIVTLFDVNGMEISSQSFSPMEVVHGTGFGWGVRIAVPVSRPVELVVTDLNGIEFLRVELEL